MFVRLYSADPVPDTDARKSYVLYSGIESVQFSRRGPVAQVTLSFADASLEQFDLAGNAYVFNDAGAPIGFFCPAPLPGMVHPQMGTA